MWKYLLEIKKHSHWHYAGVQQSLRSSVQSDTMVEKPAAGPHPPSIWVKSLAWCIMSPVWSTPRFPLSGKQCSGTVCVCVTRTRYPLQCASPEAVQGHRSARARARLENAHSIKKEVQVWSMYQTCHFLDPCWYDIGGIFFLLEALYYLLYSCFVSAICYGPFSLIWLF